MLPLFDLMMQAQNGKAMEALARQFNLAQDQAAKAVAALMPAFSSALKRQGSNPFDFATLMQKAASGNYQSYFEDFSRAFTPQGMADGNAALEQIFGSTDLARAMADQAAKLSGLGQDMMKQMMPAMADTVLGGLIKQMTGQLGMGNMGMPGMANMGMGGMGMGQMGSQANPFMPDGMAAMTEQWLQTMGLKPRKPDPMQAMFDNPFTQAMQSFFTPKAEAPKAESDPFSMNPFLKSFQDMMAPKTSEKPAEKPAGSAAPTPAEQYQAFVNQLFDSGLEVQKNYQASLDQMLEQWSAKGSA